MKEKVWFMKNYLVIFIIVCLAGAVVLLTLSVTNDSRAAYNAAKENSLAGQFNLENKLLKLKQVNASLQVDLPIADHLLALHQELDVAKGELIQVPWYIDESLETDALVQQFAVEQYKTVTFNQTMYLDVGVGEKVLLTLPCRTNLEIDVVARQLKNNGDFSWQGVVYQNGQRYPVEMTQGDLGTFGSIVTHNASYTVTTTATGVGVVYKNLVQPIRYNEQYARVSVHS